MHTPHSWERGSITTLVLGIIAFVVIIGGSYWYVSSRPSTQPESDAGHMMDDETGVLDDDSMMSNEDAGNMVHAASVQEYTQAAYDAAVEVGPVVLYYYANWCPICAVEYPHFVAAVGRFDASAATFFRVNYNDSDTTADEEASAREHQVGYQHTVVVVKNGQQTYKSMTTGDYESRLRAELN